MLNQIALLGMWLLPVASLVVFASIANLVMPYWEDHHTNSELDGQ